MKLNIKEIGLCHVKIYKEGLKLDEEDESLIIKVQDGPLEGAIINAEVNVNDIKDEYLEEE